MKSYGTPLAGRIPQGEFQGFEGNQDHILADLKFRNIGPLADLDETRQHALIFPPA